MATVVVDLGDDVPEGIDGILGPRVEQRQQDL
jgi:hypothetical protein